MGFYPKDIIKIDLPHILGDPIVEISFVLNSEKLNFSIDSNRLYNVKEAVILENTDSKVTLQCTNDSKVYIHSAFEKVQDIYYYPFISSVFSLEGFGVDSDHSNWLEISIPENFKSLTFYSYVKNRDNGEIANKKRETWLDNKGIFYFPLNRYNDFRFAVRSTGRSINYGLIPMLLPFLIMFIGSIFKFGSLPQQINNNAPAILFAVLLTFTPFYVNILQRFIARAFMSLNLGIGMYMKSYFLAIIYIVCHMLFTFLTEFIIGYSLIWFSFVVLSTFHYFKRGEFVKVLDKILFSPIVYFLRRPYVFAWKEQERIKDSQ